MHDASPAPQLPALRAPEQPTLTTTEPGIGELFRFMAEAELRFETLRMRIVDRRMTTHGEETETHEVWLHHPGRAKVISRRGDAAGRDYDVWVADGELVRTYDGRGNTATTRSLPAAPVGATDGDLPRFSQVYQPVTRLPAESLADTFIHPHGFCRNVLATGVVRRRGTQQLANGREALLLRCDHPRTSHVLTDRPDHWLEAAVDLQTGLMLLLAEHVGDQLTRHAEAVVVGVDDPIPDDALTLHISSDARILY